MRAYENLLFSKENGIGYVTINRPKALNALNAATVEELDALLDEIAADADFATVAFHLGQAADGLAERVLQRRNVDAGTL